MQKGLLLWMLTLSLSVQAASKPHVVALGKPASVKLFVGADESKSVGPKAGPCIFQDTAQPSCDAVGSTRGLWREAVQVPRRRNGSLSEERPPSFLSQAEENPRPSEPVFTRLAREGAQDREPEPTLHRGEAMDKTETCASALMSVPRSWWWR